MNDLERSLAYRPTEEDLALLRSLPAEQLPTIAVVIPSFNQARFIGQTLESVIRQGYPRTEIFVADGGSTDSSVEIIEAYARSHPGVIRYESAPDGGHRFGVNKGIANTTGDIIAWINSDDVYVDGAFWKVAAFFYFNRCAYIAYGRNHYVREDLSFVTEYPVDWSPSLREQRRRMLHFCLPPQPSLFFRRPAVTMFGALGHKVLDYELWMRWQQDLPFYFIDELLSLSRLQSEAITVNLSPDDLLPLCDVVHAYYGVVPYSWALRLAHNRVYGAAWARGETAPMTPAIRLAAWRAWLWLNLRYSPRALRRLVGQARRTLRDSMRSAA